MKKIFKAHQGTKPFLLLFILVLSSVVGIRCKNTEGKLLDYTEQSFKAFKEWKIGIKSYLAYDRNMSEGYSYNPANWLVVTNENCDGVGVPETTKQVCPFEGNVIGLCNIRYNGNNEILDTTILIDSNFQNDPNSSIREETKYGVYVHEIGHCLGLVHSTELTPEKGDHDYIMYPTAGGASKPNADELEVIRKVYLPEDGSEMSKEPTGDIGGKLAKSFFINVKDKDTVVKHTKVPSFYVYPYGPGYESLNFLNPEPKAQRGKLLKEKPNIINFYYLRDNIRIEERISSDGIRVVKKYHAH